jgi:hypothetical protein
LRCSSIATSYSTAKPPTPSKRGCCCSRVSRVRCDHTYQWTLRWGSWSPLAPPREHGGQSGLAIVLRAATACRLNALTAGDLLRGYIEQTLPRSAGDDTRSSRADQPLRPGPAGDVQRRTVPRRGRKSWTLEMAEHLISKALLKVISNLAAGNRKGLGKPPLPDFQGHFHGHEGRPGQLDVADASSGRGEPQTPAVVLHRPSQPGRSDP